MSPSSNYPLSILNLYPKFDTCEIDSLNPSMTCDNHDNNIHTNNNSATTTRHSFQQPFCSDVIFEILKYLNGLYIIQVCMRVSRQWREQVLHLNLTLSIPVALHRRSPEFVTSIAASPNLENVTVLNLSCCDINNEDVKAIVNSNYIKKLEILKFNMNSIGNEGVKASSNSENMKNLKELSLLKNSIDHEGVFQIANSVYLKNLSSLDLRHNKIGNEGVKSITCLKNLLPA